MNNKNGMSSTLLENIDYKGNTTSAKIIENALKDTDVMSDAPPTNVPVNQMQFQQQAPKEQFQPPPPNERNNQMQFQQQNNSMPQQQFNNNMHPQNDEYPMERRLKEKNIISEIKNPLILKKACILCLVACITLHTTVQEKIKRFTQNEMLVTGISSMIITLAYFIVIKVFLKVF